MISTFVDPTLVVNVKKILVGVIEWGRWTDDLIITHLPYMTYFRDNY